MSQTNEANANALKKKLASLTPEQRAHVLAKIRKHANQTNLVGEGQLSSHPLTHAQQRLWTLEQFERVPYLYHIPIVLKLDGQLNVDRLRNCIAILINQHAQLRSYFVLENEKPVQKYDEDLQQKIGEIKLSQPLNENLAIEEHAELSEFFLQPFNLEQAPLFRIAVATYEEKHYLLLCFHHLIMDAWSASILLEQLQDHYNKPAASQEVSSVIAQSANYRDYQLWEAREASKKDLSHHFHYWEHRLRHKTWQTDLPIDFLRPRHLSGKGKTLFSFIEGNEFQQLLNFAKQHQATINHIVLASLQILLARYSNQDDITLGLPIAGRTGSAWRQTIGLFVNTCLHSAAVNYRQSFIAHLQQTIQNLLQDLTQASLAYDDLIQYFYQKRLCAQGASINVLFNFIEAKKISLVFDEAPAHPILVHLPISKFDLSLHVYHQASSMQFCFEYSTELFISETIQQMMKDFLQLLLLVIQEPHKRLADLIWLSE